MNDIPKSPNPLAPSGSTLGSLIGGGAGTLLILILTQGLHWTIDAVAGGSLCTAMATAIGYFFNGGKKSDTE